MLLNHRSQASACAADLVSCSAFYGPISQAYMGIPRFEKPKFLPSPWLFLFYFVLVVVLRFELRASHLNHSTSPVLCF
jgi:hypothetical protein